MKKLAVFILENSFNKENFLNLGACLNSAGLQVEVISTRKGSELFDENNQISVKSVASYARTNPGEPDLFALVDENICEVCPSSVPNVLRQANEAGKLILSVGHTQESLVKADIVDGKKVAAPDGLKDELKDVGAIISDNDFEVSSNLITVKTSGLMDEICDVIQDKLGVRKAA